MDDIAGARRARQSPVLSVSPRGKIGAGGGRWRYLIDRYGYGAYREEGPLTAWKSVMDELGTRVVMSRTDLDKIFAEYHRIVVDRLSDGRRVSVPGLGMFYPYYRVYGRDGIHGVWMVRFRMKSLKDFRGKMTALIDRLGLRAKLGLMEKWRYGRPGFFGRYNMPSSVGDLDIGGH